MYIYLITNSINGKKYVGQTSRTPAIRWQGHLNTARSKNFGIHPLYRAIRKYGQENFTVEEIWKASSQEELNQKEIDFIITYKTIQKEFGYNRHEGGNKPPPTTPEARMKAGLKMRGVPKSEEHRAAISKALMGKTLSPETIAKMKLTKSILGCEHTEETKAKMSKTRKGRPHSPEHSQAIANAQMGKTHSEETKQKISASKTNPSAETRERLRISHLGHKPSEETRAKMSAAQKRRHEKKELPPS